MLGGRPVPEHVRAIFLTSCEASLAALDAAFDDGDASRMQAELHSLRGALSVFGYEGLADQCAQMQSRISKEGVPAVPSMIDAFDSDLRAALSALPDSTGVNLVVDGGRRLN